MDWYPVLLATQALKDRHVCKWRKMKFVYLFPQKQNFTRWSHVSKIVFIPKGYYVCAPITGYVTVFTTACWLKPLRLLRWKQWNKITSRYQICQQHSRLTQIFDSMRYLCLKLWGHCHGIGGRRRQVNLLSFNSVEVSKFSVRVNEAFRQAYMKSLSLQWTKSRSSENIKTRCLRYYTSCWFWALWHKAQKGGIEGFVLWWFSFAEIVILHFHWAINVLSGFTWRDLPWRSPPIRTQRVTVWE